MTRLGPGTPATRKMHTPGLESLAFRFLVAVDVAGFSQRHAAEQARAQDDLEMAITQAAKGIPYVGYLYQSNLGLREYGTPASREAVLS